MRNKIQLSLFLTLLILGVQGKFTASYANSVDFTYSGECYGSPTVFTIDTTDLPVGAIVTTYFWDFGDGQFYNGKNAVHTYPGPGTRNATLTILDDNGIVYSKSKQVVILELPFVNFSFPIPNCSDQAIQFTDESKIAPGYFNYIDQWQWDFGDASPIETITLPGDLNPKHTFQNSGEFNVTLTVVNSKTCVNHITLPPVKVTSSPKADFTNSGQCEDQVVVFTDASDANGTVSIAGWDWDFDDVFSSGVDNTSTDKNPSHTFSIPGTYNVKLVVRNFNGCTDTIIKPLVINPHPPVDFTNSAICLGAPVSFSPDLSVMNIASISDWAWNFGYVETSQTLYPDKTFWSTGDYPVTFTVTDMLGCMNEATHTVKVNPLPLAQFSTNFSYCAGAEVQFHDLSVLSPFVGTIDQWTWDFGDGNSMTVNHPGNPDVSHVYPSGGDYDVSLTVTSSGGCIGTVFQKLVVHSNPVADFASTTACKGTAVAFTDLSLLNGGGSISQWNWDFGDPGSGILNFSSLPQPQHSFVVAGNPIVQLIVTNTDGCKDTITHVVLVHSPPAVAFSTAGNCQNSDVSFIPDPVVMNPVVITSWNWDFGTGVSSSIQNPTYTFNSSGPQYVTLTVVDTAGCSNDTSQTVIISPEPTVKFSFPQPVCNQSEVKFDNISTVPAGNFIVKSEWDFGDGNTQDLNTLASVFHTYATYNTYLVTLTITTNDGCKKTLSQPLVILPHPVADFSNSGSCLNSPVHFTDLSLANVGIITDWKWLFGDAGSGIDNTSLVKFPNHTYNTSGTFPVRLIVTNSGGCIDTIVKQVIVHDLPVVDFTSSPGCVNELSHFVSSSFVNAGAVASRYWSFGDGHNSNEADPTNTYVASGSYTVTLTITDTAGCINTKKQTVVIAESPSALFVVSAQGCAHTPVSFSILPSMSGSPVVSYFWEFGDGKDTLILAPGAGNVSHAYALVNNYTAFLTVQTSQGCKAQSQRTFTISPAPIAQFSFVNSCQGSAVNFKDLSQVNSGSSIISWSWNFGDPASATENTSTQKNPYHAFNAPGKYKVELQVVNLSGCSNTIVKTIEIYPKPPVDFDWSGGCASSATKFTVNSSVTDISTVTSYDWDFGDGTAHTSSQNPDHTYTVTGILSVALTIVNTNGCTNTISHSISITPQPSAYFSSNSSCQGTSTQFTDQSFSSNGAPITGWHWDFGLNAVANDTSGMKNPSWIYKTPGVYQVKLTVTSQSGCQNAVIFPTQVFGNPTANFSYAASPCGNGAVYFQDSSYSKQAPIVAYNWEFEPNHYSTLQDPSYVFYSSDSCYNVRLIATDVRGCFDTVYKEVCVPAEFNFSFVASNTCLFDSTSFTPQQLGYSTGTLVSFNWNFGDPNASSNNTSTKKSPSHYYTKPGDYTVSLQATDAYNCLRIVEQKITILPLPVSYFSYTEGACDSSLYFHDASFSVGSTINRWTWNYGDGIIETIESPASPNASHKYKVPGLYEVSLSVTNAVGCSNQTTNNNALVKSCLFAAFELIDTLVCQNNIVSFSDKSSSTNTTNKWYWDFGDGNHLQYSNYINRVDHVFDTSGTFKVQLILSTNFNGREISDTAKMSVIVNPTPLPDFIFGTVCHEQNAAFTNMTSGNGTKIVSYNWAFGEPSSAPQDTSTLKNPAHIYGTPGTYDITLVVKNTIGCTDSIQKSLTVHGLPEANYTYSVSCAGENTKFTDLSIAAISPIVKWDWTFYDAKGIGGVVQNQNPDYIFTEPGDYPVNLKVTDIFGCFDTINQNVTTWRVPVSLFTYIENVDQVQGKLQFTNNSEEAVTYHWEFGDGSESFTENPAVSYENNGTYDISLVTWNDKGCSDTLVAQYKFMVKGLYIPNAFSPTNMKPEVQLLKPIGINLAEYRFEVFDRWGNLLWWTDKLDSEGRPVEGWDGKYQGNLLPEGAYPWKASGVFKDGSIWEAENVGNNDHLPKFNVGTATMIR